VPAFDNALALVGCPDRRIGRLCITCCSPFPTFTSRPTPAYHVASATGSFYHGAIAPTQSPTRGVDSSASDARSWRYVKCSSLGPHSKSGMPRPSALDWRKLKAGRFRGSDCRAFGKGNERTMRDATRNLLEFAPALIAVGEPPKSGMYREDLEPSPFMASQLRPPPFGADQNARRAPSFRAPLGRGFRAPSPVGRYGLVDIKTISQ